MTYRFAQSSFWGALAFADVELPAPLTWGVVKGLQLRNIRYWARQPGAYNANGTLTIGYNYPNHNMTENYNSPGSPYWCCKSFIALSLPETHPFWASTEEPYPDVLLNTTQLLKNPLHIASNLGGHTFVLSSGQQCSYDLKQSAAKYGKYAYSAAFGYSVPVGNGTLEEAGFDSALALSDDGGEFWRCRRKTLDARFEPDGTLRSSWRPWPDVEIETWLVPPTHATPHWHLRIHRIRTGRRLWTADAGFAIYGQRADGRHLDKLESESDESVGYFEGGAGARAVSKAGVSGIVKLDPKSVVERKGRVVRLDANSNLMEPRTVVPALVAEVEPREEDVWLVTAVFAFPSRCEKPPTGWSSSWEKRPEVPGSIVLPS
jgi:hypothetical protein